MQSKEGLDEALLVVGLPDVFGLVPQVRQSCDDLVLTGRLPLVGVRVGQVVPGLQCLDLVLGEVDERGNLRYVRMMCL